MSYFACCCFYPKYKRKVDNIYPRDLDHDLIQSEMTKLCYYAVNHQDKLSKIADYLYQNLKWGLSGRYRNKNYVKSTIQAVDTILLAINAHQLNIYTTNYLKIIQKLLDQNDTFYKKLATDSFQKFCKKERTMLSANQSAPLKSFIAMFCSMCYNDEEDAQLRDEIQVSCLQCLKAIVKHLAPDESALAPFLWENIDIVINSLLYVLSKNFSDDRLTEMMRKRGRDADDADEDLARVNLTLNDGFEMKNLLSDSESAPVEALSLLREISIKSDFVAIQKILDPVYAFMSNLSWENEAFNARVYNTIMSHVKQTQEFIVKDLITRLDNDTKTDTRVKTRIASTANTCIPNSMANPFVIDIFNMLLKCLSRSIERYYANEASSESRGAENELQNKILNLMRNFTPVMPDYSKNEVIFLIANEINSSPTSYHDLIPEQRELRDKLKALIRIKYVDALYEICSKYEPKQVFGAFSSDKFLTNILSLSITSDTGTRKKIHDLMQFLMDKNFNVRRITAFHEKKGGNLVQALEIDTRVSKEDMHFMRKNGRLFLAHLSEGLFLKDNLRSNFEAIFVTLALFTIGINEAEFFVDFVLFAFHVQELTLANYQQLSFNSICELLSFLTSYFEVLLKICRIGELKEYLAATINLRRSDEIYAKFLNSEFVVSRLSRRKNETSESEDELFETEVKNAAQCFIRMHKSKADKSTRGSMEQLEKQLESFEWLFNKKKIVDILKENRVVVKQHDFSLSVTYLTEIGLKNSLLKFRSLAYLNENRPVTVGVGKPEPVPMDNKMSSSVSASSIDDSVSVDSDMLPIGRTTFVIGGASDLRAEHGDTTFDNTIRRALYNQNATISNPNLTNMDYEDEQSRRKALNEFKKKTFDEVQMGFRKNNADNERYLQANNEKYMQVMEFIKDFSPKPIEKNFLTHNHLNSSYVKREGLDEIELPAMFLNEVN